MEKRYLKRKIITLTIEDEIFSLIGDRSEIEAAVEVINIVLNQLNKDAGINATMETVDSIEVITNYTEKEFIESLN